MENLNALYVDGGVISVNPSPIGGTWACRILENDVVVCEASGVITPEQAGMTAITNNLTEMLALLCGLERLPVEWKGVVYSDSQVTLGRAFQGWKWTNIPLWMHQRYQQAVRRLLYWGEVGYVLLDGHPTQEQLAAGIGKRGHPVSKHNVWCDVACGTQAKAFQGALCQTKVF